MQEVIIPVRVIFAKAGRAKYISHLDTMRTITRALRRSGLPFWYTQGFNPHLYLTFPLPLALGVESLCEPLDFRIIRETPFERVRGLLEACFPPGFEVKSAAAPVMSPSDIAWAEYRIEMGFPEKEREDMLAALEALFAAPAIEVIKKGKKGERPLDIRPHAALLDKGVTEEGIQLEVRLAAGSALNVSPSLLLEAFAQRARPADNLRILRTRICSAQMLDFA